MSFKLIELGLVTLKKFFNRLYQLNVPLLEVFRYQVCSVTGFWPVFEKTKSEPDIASRHTTMLRDVRCVAVLWDALPFSTHPHTQ